MGYISNNNLLSLSTTQPHLHLTHSSHINNGNDHSGELITVSSELGDRKSNFSAATSRWNPTPEQITALEKLYKNGTRTPTTEQIQQIASKLRKYGRVEGKNVFYWFQNHKSRERLRRRRLQDDEMINNVPEPHKHVKDGSSSGVVQTKSCPSFPQPQHELVWANNEDHGMPEEAETASDNGKDATWRHLVTWSVTQEEEEAREIRTLNLFPVMENQEKTGRFTEKKNEKANQVTCCDYCYYYEFMPLKN